MVLAKRKGCTCMSTIEHVLPVEAHGVFPWQRYLLDTVLAFGAAMLVTAIIYLFQLYPRIPNISIVYLLVVLALASTRGRYPAILASLVAFLAFDFFLVPPLYVFPINRIEEWIALFVFLVTAILTSQLAVTLRQRAEQASRREREARILYELVRATNSEEELERLLSIIAQAVVDVFSSWGVLDCALLLPDARGKLTVQASTRQPADQLSSDERASAAWVMTHGQTAGLYEDAPHTPGKHAGSALRIIVQSTALGRVARRSLRLIPLKTSQQVVGVLRLRLQGETQRFTTEEHLEEEQEHPNARTAFFWTFLDQATSVIERARLRRENMRIELLQRTDELRAALLSSVSHDLRTPLSSIKAAASSLLQEDVQWDEETRRSFALTIEHEADRLNRLVGNLLDMSRIEGGALKPEKEWYPISELIHDVLGHLQDTLQEREVRVSLPDDLPPVELDYLQMDQVLTNLLENAARYTLPCLPIEISGEATDEHVIIGIADHGPGIPPHDLERIFDKFYRVSGTVRRTSSVMGTGLGLAVCRGLVEAHGGHIWAENRTGGGAILRFSLPLARIRREII